MKVSHISGKLFYTNDKRPNYIENVDNEIREKRKGSNPRTIQLIEF